MLPDPLAAATSNGDDSYSRSNDKAKNLLETLCVKYPEDMEARALLALWSMGGDRYGAELMIREVLAKQPDHPGAHHYRIHNWDYHEPEQALESSRRYGVIVPASAMRCTCRATSSASSDVERSGHLDGRRDARRKAVHAAIR